ncbi:hypothetical protein WJX72_001563 [[Myrmecia] bisecta]|uniref:Uncharacterized protein n=1 Tax=[Myrmecia] bisecta TaxID=41462 RepID=A0AAW1PI70_9CHLO
MAKPSRRDELVCALEDKLKDFKAENALLGRLLQDLQAERDEFQTRLSTAQRAEQEATHSAAAERQKAQDLQNKLSASLQEAQRLRSCLKAQAGQVEKWRSSQQDLEDALLDTKDEAERQAKELAAASKTVMELQDKLKAANKRAQEAIKGQQQLEGKAEKAADKAAQQLRALQAEHARTQQQLQSNATELQQARALKAHAEQASSSALEELKQRHASLQSAMADASVQHASACCSLQHQMAHWRRRAEEAEHERDIAVAGLSAIQGSEDVMHTTTHVALAQAERIRRELTESAERCEELHASNLQLTNDNLQLARDLAHTESVLKDSRAQIGRLHAALLESETRTAFEVRQLACASVQQESESGSGSTESLQEQVKVLQYTIEQLEAKQHTLAAQVAVANAEQAEAAEELAMSREKELATLRALQTELRRVQALERLRLTDVSELHDLQRRLQLAHQTGWHLRETVAQERLNRRCPLDDMHAGHLIGSMHDAPVLALG